MENPWLESSKEHIKWSKNGYKQAEIVIKKVSLALWEHNVQRSSLPILIFIILLHCPLLLSMNIQNWRGDRYAGIRACLRIETYSGPLRKGSRG